MGAMKGLTPLQFTLLTAVAEHPSHGYALIADAERALGHRPGVATVYSALDHLMEAGWIVQSRDEVVEGRLRRYFTITPPGASMLAAEAQKLASRAARAIRTLQRMRPVEVGA